MGFLIWFALSGFVYAEAPVLSFFGEYTEQEEAKKERNERFIIHECHDLLQM